eukprot:gene2611-3571_t
MKQFVQVQSENVTYDKGEIKTKYTYDTIKTTTKILEDGSKVFVSTPKKTNYEFKTNRNTPKMGLMIVGWGGNNGTTLTGAIHANKNKITWKTKTGKHQSNYFGSITQSATVKLGTDENNEDVHVPFNNLLPMVSPNDLVLGGWDICGNDLAIQMENSQVFDYNLQEQLKPYMKELTPLPSIYIEEFVATNQKARATNILKGEIHEQVETLRQNIKDFKSKNNLDKVIILWSATTEKFSQIQEGVNDTSENLLNSIKKGEKNISPSTLFAVASILEGCSYINGSPQNTFVPGVIELAKEKKVFICGDDFKSGQTKVKSVLADFLVSAGLKLKSVASYNHLGNNDGLNLSETPQFKSKELTKRNVIDDVMSSNSVLYEKDEKIDHIVVIKYVPHVGDSKRAIDEYVSEIFMGGENVLSIYNVCEDSLLAAPIMIDLAILTELFERIQWKTDETKEFQSFDSILSVLGYLLKAPLYPKDQKVVNSLFKQRSSLENILKAIIGLPCESNMDLELKI